MFTDLNKYDVEMLSYGGLPVELTKTKFEVICYLGKFDLAKQMKATIDFELKEKIDLPGLAKAIGKNGFMYTFTDRNYVKLMIAREAIKKAGFPVFTGWILSNDIDYEISEDDGKPSSSINFLLTSKKFVTEE